MRLPAGLVDKGGFRRALDVELDNPHRLLPAGLPAKALDNKRDEAAEWAFGQTAGEFPVSPGQIVAVSKARHGMRPVAVWDLPSRLLYSALVERLAPSLPSIVRGADAWSDFQQRPLSEHGRYIVSADLASCYSLIDHGLLAEEIQLQTGDHQIETVAPLSSIVYSPST